jgi:hypothetical protein
MNCRSLILFRVKILVIKNQYSEWCRQFVHEQVQKLRELQVPGQEHNKTCQTGRNQADMPKADKVSESLSQDKHNDFPSSAVSHHQQAVCSMSQMSLACDVACPTAVSASTRDCSLSTVDTEELPDVSQELLNSVLSHSSSVLYKHDTPVKLASKTTGIKAKSVASSDNNGDVPAYPPYSQVNVLSKPADTHPDVRESQIVLSGESQKLQTSSQIKDSVRTSLLAAGTHRVSQFTAGEGPLPCNLPNVGADCRPIPPQLADGQLFVLPEELEQLKQQPLNDLGKQTVGISH